MLVGASGALDRADKLLAGGAPSTVVNGAYKKLRKAGRAVVILADTGDSSSACGVWSNAGGYQTLPDLSEAYPGNLDVTTSTSGDLALLRGGDGASPQSVVTLSTVSLISTVVSVPAGISLGECAAHGEAFVCHGMTPDGQLSPVLIDGANVQILASIPYKTNPRERVIELGDAAIFFSLGKAHRLSYGVGGVVTTYESTTNAVLMQDGWIATNGDYQAPEVKVMREDGSQLRSVAQGVKIADWLAQSNPTYSHRLRWVPICDVDATQQVSNLRFYNPQTDQTVSASSSCRVVGMSFSDNYVVYYDNWVPDPTGVISAGSGDLMMMDLRDGSKRQDPFDDDNYYTFSAVPTGKSKFLAGWSSAASGDELRVFNAHTSPTTKAAALPTSVDWVREWELGSGGVVLATRFSGGTDPVSEAYYLGL